MVEVVVMIHSLATVDRLHNHIKMHDRLHYRDRLHNHKQHGKN